MMYHECKVYCHAIPEEQAKALDMQAMPGKWLPFTLYLGCVNAFKMTTDDGDDETQYCTTVYTDAGDVYILSTPYAEFNRKWKSFMNDIDEEETPPSDLDL